MAERVNRNMVGLFLSLLSSATLLLSFPPFDIGVLAWAGLMPLFIVISSSSLWKGFVLSYICGAFFFLGVFNWILSVSQYTMLHHAILAVYLGLYFGIFGLAFNFIYLRRGITFAFFAAPFIWVSLEYIRSNLSFLALPWGLIGHTQYMYPDVIQVTALAGTYSISFMIVMVNAAIAAVVYACLPRSGMHKQFRDKPFLKKADLALIIIAASTSLFALQYGHWITSRPITGKRVKISAVQGNIDQAKKWDPKYAQEIMRAYANLTQKASSQKPALIIWPETATPGSINRDPKLLGWLKEIARGAQASIVLGSAQYRKFEKAEGNTFKYMNSAFLVTPGDQMSMIHQYNKIRLFPFGEYLPYKNIIPWDFINVSSISEYMPGKKFTVFEHPDFRFAVTICWENIFPDLVRQFVKRGAQFIVNITNEARFGKSDAPYQLAGISVFRAVENRIYVIRCSNTGISCIIDPFGRIVKRLQDENGNELFVRGILHGMIIPMESKTFYTRNGDLVPILAIAVSLVFIFMAWSKPLAKRKKARDVEGQ